MAWKKSRTRKSSRSFKRAPSRRRSASRSGSSRAQTLRIVLQQPQPQGQTPFQALMPMMAPVQTAGGPVALPNTGMPIGRKPKKL